MKNGIDERLAAALYDVPVPAGLAERLLERLKDKEFAAPKPDLRPAVAVHTSAGGRSIAFIATMAATAAGLLIALWLGTRTSDDLSPQYVLDEAIRSFDLVVDEPGTPLAQKTAPAAYPLSDAVVAVRGTRWRHLDSFLGRRGVMYDLPGPAGTGASLFVVSAEGLEGYDESPTLYPYTTAGCCASSWQEGGLLYVLVVRGDSATYRAYLNLPRGPMA